MSKPSPARYRTTNWSSNTASLRKRGSLPLRQTTGMVASLLKMADLDRAVPDDTTLCRRQKTLAVQVPYRRADGPLNLLVDRTGIKFLGDGAWQVRMHGIQGRRQWRKVHLAMDTATSDIRAVEFTPSSDGDRPVLPELPDQIPEGEQIGTVTADGACDTRRCRTDHPHSQERPTLEGRLPGRSRPKQNTPRHTAQRQGVQEALDRIPCPKPDQGQDPVPEGLW
jgi:Transposase DDE domain